MLRELGILGGGVICVLLGLFFHSNLGLQIPAAVAIAGGLWLAFSFATGFHLGPVLLAMLLVAHALVGYVELGTDSWIGKITGNIMSSKQAGLALLVYTSSLMFILRFFAGPIVERTSPLGLLCASGVIGATGLTLLGSATSVLFCVFAATVYACGKTFLWPTMLAVGSEQFPRGGAITIGAIGGVGMLSAGLLGGPAIGFKQDYFASKDLKEKALAVYERYKAPHPNEFLGLEVQGLDGSKVGVLDDEGKNGVKTIVLDLDRLKKEKDKSTSSKVIAEQEALVAWWKQAEPTAKEDKELVKAATLYGSRMALRLTAAVPALMALIYLGMILYFKTKGGYRPQMLIDKHEEALMMTGGTVGPAEF
jgi:hypothetical protein